MRGFTLIEVVIGATLFALIGVSVYQGYTTILTLVSASRAKIAATDLINEQLELIRNLPYQDVGVVGGIPSGLIPNIQAINRDGSLFTVTTTIRNIDDPFDGVIGGAPNDLSPADYKLVQIDLACSNCKNFSTMDVSTRVAPKNLETASTNGALFVRAIDANGQPIVNAQVHIENNAISPPVVIDDVTGIDGSLQIVDAPPGNNAYEITVTKSGFTTDKTYATSTGNPTPTKPHATVLLQQVTQISFIIDQVSTVNVSTLTGTCTPVSGISFSMKGTKLLGTDPDVYKYDNTFVTGGSGLSSLPNVEWDTYSLVVNTAGYYLAGVNPLLPVTVLPGATQNINLILTNDTPSHLLVTVKDSATLLPVSGATVTLTKSGYSNELLTGRGYLQQTDWSGGGGQSDFLDSTKYFSSDGQMDSLNPTGELKLNNIFGVYVPSGELISSTFDTGTTSNFNQISWNPTSQPPAVGTPNVRFYFASSLANNASTTWSFLGPDGTGSTYYDVSNTNINSVHNNDRYFRYKLLFNTASSTFTPIISDVSTTFTSECIPPGQVFFSGLSTGTSTITVNKAGYAQSQIDIDISGNSNQQEIILFP